VNNAASPTDVRKLQEVLSNHLYTLNQVYELKRRLRNCRELSAESLRLLDRPLERIEEHLSGSLYLPEGPPNGCGLIIDDPQGESYDECRTDLEAELVGEGDGPLMVVEVVRPVIRLVVQGQTWVVQRGRVVVALKAEQEKGAAS